MPVFAFVCPFRVLTPLRFLGVICFFFFASPPFPGWPPCLQKMSGFRWSLCCFSLDQSPGCCLCLGGGWGLFFAMRFGSFFSSCFFFGGTGPVVGSRSFHFSRARRGGLFSGLILPLSKILSFPLGYGLTLGFRSADSSFIHGLAFFFRRFRFIFPPFPGGLGTRSSRFFPAPPIP